MEKKKYIDVLTRRAETHRRPYELALNDLLDYLLDVFSIRPYMDENRSLSAHFRVMADKDNDFAGLAFLWLEDVARAMERGEWLDVFGIIYEEMYLTRGKASTKGQFFTPRSVSDLMAQVINGKECGTVNDCAAGSGRLLLSHFSLVTRDDHAAAGRYTYIAQDSDPTACKMCALNMMAHGMFGRVVFQDTLAMSPPSVVYHINEVRRPFPTPYYSIRAEMVESGNKL